MWTIDTVAFCTCLSNEYGSDVAASVPIIFVPSCVIVEEVIVVEEL